MLRVPFRSAITANVKNVQKMFGTLYSFRGLSMTNKKFSATSTVTNRKSPNFARESQEFREEVVMRPLEGWKKVLTKRNVKQF